MGTDLVFSVTEFVALLNQTLEYAYPTVTVRGELANFRVSKNKWVYFDIKDEAASVKCFGTVYQLPGPLEDGMLLQVRGVPRLHPQYGFSLNVISMQPAGEGSLKKAAELLQHKLTAEGLFAPERKRSLPYPPRRIGLITSGESAAYHDFLKILGERWGGMEVMLADVQVQGEASVGQVVRAIEHFNTQEVVEVVVITRGGGSAEDLAAFSTEQVTRAVASSRIPTLVAVGHEIDISLAELAADQRASTPSNAAELLTPDKKHVLQIVGSHRQTLDQLLERVLLRMRQRLRSQGEDMHSMCQQIMRRARERLQSQRQVVAAFSPRAVLARGYAIVRMDRVIVRSVQGIKEGDVLSMRLHDGSIAATVNRVQYEHGKKE